MSIGGNQIEYIPLGISSGTPTKDRNVSSGILKVQDNACILIDCGENCQQQIMKSNIKFSWIKMILITHMHGDHVFGLPGLLSTMSHMRKKVESQDEGASASASASAMEVLHIYGPYPLASYLRTCLLATSTKLGFNYQVHELIPDAHVPESVTPDMDFGVHIYKFDSPQKYHSHHNEVHDPESQDHYISNTYGIWQVNKNIIAVPVKHKVAGFAYIYTGDRKPGKFMVDRYVAAGGKVGPEITKLQREGSVTIGDKTFKLEDFKGPDVEGKKVVITGDTCNNDRLAPYARDCDLLIHEATFGIQDSYNDKDSAAAGAAVDEAIVAEAAAKAVVKGHSTTVMAAEFATAVNAKKLIITHFSSKYDDDDLEKLGREARQVFPNSSVAKELEPIGL